MSEMTIRLKVDELQLEISRTINDAYEEGKSVGRADAIEEQKEFWDMQNHKAYEQGRTDAIDKYVDKAITKFREFAETHGYPTYADVWDVLHDVMVDMKEQKYDKG